MRKFLCGRLMLMLMRRRSSVNLLQLLQENSSQQIWVLFVSHLVKIIIYRQFFCTFCAPVNQLEIFDHIGLK